MRQSASTTISFARGERSRSPPSFSTCSLGHCNLKRTMRALERSKMPFLDGDCFAIPPIGLRRTGCPPEIQWVAPQHSKQQPHWCKGKEIGSGKDHSRTDTAKDEREGHPHLERQTQYARKRRSG